jgi:hypothetical protein
MLEKDILHSTLKGFESGFQVRLIATMDLVSCESDARVEDVLSNDEWTKYSQIAIRKDGRIYGVLERKGLQTTTGTVRDHMRELDDSLLIPASAPIEDFIRLSEASEYRLVLDQGGIRGVVTRTDLQKLPVRVVVFTVITHLESLMAALIRRTTPVETEWLEKLPARRRSDINKRFEQLLAQDREIDRLALTFFSDKVHVIAAYGALPAPFQTDLDDIADLRNKIAHADDYVPDQAAFRDFPKRYRKVCHWVDQVREAISVAEGPR